MPAPFSHFPIDCGRGRASIDSMKILIDILIISVVASTLMFLYRTYQEPITDYLFDTNSIGIHVRDIPLRVQVSDTDLERQQGLSGLESMGAEKGMIFVFEKEGDYLFWMKDMLFPIDILWINNNLEVVHIEKNVKPDSYPVRYGSPAPARFVLETNAFFVDTFNIRVGDKIKVPSNWLPLDLRTE